VLKTNFFVSHSTFIFLILTFLFFTSAAQLNDGLSEDVLKYTNKFRKSNGLKALEMRNDLNAIARKHSEDMAKGRRSFGHGGYNQRELQVKKIIKPFSGMAENVAYGASNGKEAFEIWKNSSGHRKNMLGNYKYIGIGTARNRRGVIYYTQIFVK
jgi:uncharacterized protein YkwD